MRNLFILSGAALLVTACGSSGGMFGDRDAPDEMAISRNAPLVVPPDFNMQPPRPGAPRAIESETQTQAMEALFGPGVRPPEASRSEQLLLDDAGAKRSSPGARATVGDTDTMMVDKGAQVKDIVAAPVGTADAGIASASVGG
ncbi:MAG: DUF3035 domain-containing protein [Pacificimonas sp.]